jgi:wyosine [tRNA(Phe)-imidazoG37] synthetase (radical SAM superfamily)
LAVADMALRRFAQHPGQVPPAIGPETASPAGSRPQDKLAAHMSGPAITSIGKQVRSRHRISHSLTMRRMTPGYHSGVRSGALSIAFGPIPSRRLGHSLGVNNIPPKQCSYACGYCQVSCVTRMATRRQVYYSPQTVVSDVRQRAAECRRLQQRVDYVSFVPDGEPTLDVHLGEEIRGVRELGLRVAVITNGTLLWRTDVRRELAAADLVSVKIDAVTEAAWRRVNRPSPELRLDWVLAGIADFARDFPGRLLTETMLVAGANDDEREIDDIANFLAALSPAQPYLAVPTRPPFESGVGPPADATVVRAYALMRERLPGIELLGVEVVGQFGRTGSALDDLLGILLIHPMLQEAVAEYLGKAGLGMDALAPLLADGTLRRIAYRDQWFYTRRISPAVAS